MNSVGKSAFGPLLREAYRIRSDRLGSVVVDILNWSRYVANQKLPRATASVDEWDAVFIFSVRKTLADRRRDRWVDAWFTRHGI